MDADARRAKRGVVKRRDAQAVVVSRDKNVRRAVVRSRRAYHAVSRRHADDEITAPRGQRVAYEPAALCPPSVLETLAKVAREERGDSVFEPLAATIRERKVVRIGADAKRGRQGGRRRGQRRGSDAAHASDGEN